MNFNDRCEEVITQVKNIESHLNKIKVEAYKPVVEQLLLIYGIELAQFKFKPGREFRFSFQMGVFFLHFGPYVMTSTGDTTLQPRLWLEHRLIKALRRIVQDVARFYNLEDDIIPYLLDGRTIPLTSKEIP